MTETEELRAKRTLYELKTTVKAWCPICRRYTKFHRWVQHESVGHCADCGGLFVLDRLEQWT